MNNTSTIQSDDLSISDLLSGDLKLTTPPNLYFELQKAMERPTYRLDDVAFIIEKDPALSLRLLKIVNSAYYGFPSQITNISQAISVIGMTDIQNLVLAAVVIDKFTELPGGVISMHDFWAKSLRCALIARDLNAYLKIQPTDATFICGLLHNIGQLVFYRRIPELARMVVLEQKDFSDDEEVRIEESVIGFNHYEVGATLTELWKLPNTITETIRLHTQPMFDSPIQKMATLIRTANNYAQINMADCNSDTNSLDLPIEIVRQVMEQSCEEFELIFKIFYPAAKS